MDSLAEDIRACGTTNTGTIFLKFNSATDAHNFVTKFDTALKTYGVSEEEMK